MAYIILLLIGISSTAVCMYIAMDSKRRRLAARESELETRGQRMAEAEKAAELELQARRREIEAAQAETADLEARKQAFEACQISYKELQGENLLLKRDLRNLDVHVRKLDLDRQLQQENQERLDERSRELAERYIKDVLKWIDSGLTANNYVASKERLTKVLNWCREIGFQVDSDTEARYFRDLKAEYEKLLRAALEREEQARIKARIREEQQVQREIDRELARAERERQVVEAALRQALAEMKDEHSAEVQHLRARLAEAETSTQRAISRAQMTKAGNVYIISNIGAFGEGIFKIGMTRRLEPLDRIKELGDASVPFPFDIHMMISSLDAPALECALHRELHRNRINKVNPRKEYFRVDLEEIRRVVEKHHGHVEYVADVEALEWRQSQSASIEDQEYIEQLYEDYSEDDRQLADVG